MLLSPDIQFVTEFRRVVLYTDLTKLVYKNFQVLNSFYSIGYQEKTTFQLSLVHLLLSFQF